MTSEFKAGTRVRITGDTRKSLHGLKPGAEGTLTGDRIYTTGGLGVRVNKGTFRYVYPEDFVVIEDGSDASPGRYVPLADPVNHPQHYTSHPSGVECLTITEHMGFNLGNALKYIWRCDLKNDAIEDLRKSVFYIEREIAKRERA